MRDAYLSLRVTQAPELIQVIQKPVWDYLISGTPEENFLQSTTFALQDEIPTYAPNVIPWILDQVRKLSIVFRIVCVFAYAVICRIDRRETIAADAAFRDGAESANQVRKVGASTPHPASVAVFCYDARYGEYAIIFLL